jgi:hypothetical protein
MKQEALEGGLVGVSEVNKHGIVSDSLTRRSGRENILKVKDVAVINTRRIIGIEVEVHNIETEKASADSWQRHCWFVSVRAQANKVSDPLTRGGGRSSLENWLALGNKAATSRLHWRLSWWYVSIKSKIERWSFTYSQGEKAEQPPRWAGCSN